MLLTVCRLLRVERLDVWLFLFAISVAPVATVVAAVAAMVAVDLSVAVSVLVRGCYG